MSSSVRRERWLAVVLYWIALLKLLASLYPSYASSTLLNFRKEARAIQS